MGCSFSSEEIKHLYPSALPDDHDCDILALWNKFLRGDCTKWKQLVASGKTGGKPPAVYWSDEFKNRMVQNISTTYPCIAAELESRPIKVMARILCSIMEFCLINIITDSGRNFSTIKSEDERREEQLAKIVRAHCKWQINDAAYINVENAMMDALRICLGVEFTPDIEVRLRYKYARVKRDIQLAQAKFERKNTDEAESLTRQADIRMGEILETRREEEERSNSGRNMEEDASPMRAQYMYSKMTAFSVRDIDHSSARSLMSEEGAKGDRETAAKP